MGSATCAVPDCARPRRSRFQMYCRLHYDRLRATGSVELPTLEDRFWAKVEKTDSCWLWTAHRAWTGYGQIGDGQKVKMAHRVAYELLVGPIPGGLQIDHLCRVRHCVNPAHLEAVTVRENTLRGEGPTARLARQTHCHRGHPFDEANTAIVIRPGCRSRQCRTCVNEWKRNKRRRLKSEAVR